ncbi:iron complex outermembrane recepter protein [Cnuella takakiae]|uniref:Iron complex outermembrane recepter protein n=1 Tax=Cnuella takakiae TaxID=1302690 RepID=A0A1M4V3S6_9BACT|nr:TonB-dependent receptor [Cnuella takakiae]OLY92718.1 hypothetical protein BUE76_13080 [Cnuella takakiae]SHE63550.1 iron complex outermembrane recepter protein [Cnuella takakiae]
MKYFVCSTALLLALSPCFAQQPDSSLTQSLPEVVVRSFEQNRRLRDVPAAINVVGSQALNRFGPASLVPAVNSTPGVRLEERSPGSYRFNIRGSSLRSPFGVRNVKVYFNDIPYTLPGGTTYLNQLGFYNIQSLEIIKGPGSSLYGPGTGGVVLIESLPGQLQTGVQADYTLGSYNSHNAHAAVNLAGEGSQNRISYQHQQSDGYRQQSALKRDVASWAGRYQLGSGTVLRTSFLYGNLFYETPGALTAAEFKTNPRAARPGTPTQPSAIIARASIRQESFLAGASLEHKLSDVLTHKTVLYGASTSLRNPNLRGYDQSTEPHFGGRTQLSWSPQVGTGTLQVQGGAEGQWGSSDIVNFKNLNGKPDSLRYRDDVRNRQALVFAQAIYALDQWQFTAGASINSYKLAYQRFAPQTSGQQNRSFNNEFAGRLALLRKLGNSSVYASVARGFSPPSISELLPTGGAINNSLSPETGINYDLGTRGNFGKLQYDLNLFYFALQNTIVQRRDAAGGDFYLNSGKTSQKGLELALQYPFFHKGNTRANAWASFTHHAFKYRNFKQLANDFSGNRIPGVAPNSLAAGTDVQINRFSVQLSYQYIDALPLNDANTERSGINHLMNAQVQYRLPFLKEKESRLYAGADNLFNQRYALGYDINAFGGRYYNAAPKRNYFVGLSFSL